MTETASGLADALRHWAEHRPHSPVVSLWATAAGEQHCLSYRELYRGALCQGSALAQQGVEPGAPVIILAPRATEVAVGFFGCLYAGATPVVAPTFSDGASAYRLLPQRMDNLSHRTGARFLLTSAQLAERLAALTTRSGCRVLRLDGDDGERPTPDPDRCSAPPGHETRADDIAYLQFSSGSSGLPKSALLSHAAVSAHLRALSDGFPFGAEDITVGWLPLNHDMGLVTQLLLPVYAGARSVIIDPQHWVRRPASLLKALHRHRGTASWMPNFAFAHLLRTLRDRDLAELDLSCVRTLGCGGEPVHAEVMRAFSERLAPVGLAHDALKPSYGLAENMLGVTRTPAGEALRVDWISRRELELNGRAVSTDAGIEGSRSVVSCGLPFPGTQVEIIDDHGKVLDDRCLGEVRLRGSGLFSGYLDAQASGTCGVQRTFFDTGDLGYRADGHLYLCERKKDLVVSAGRNLFPHEIEATATAALGRRAGRAAAFGLYQPQLGTEQPVLLLEVQGSPDTGEADAMAARVRRALLDELDIVLADLRLLRRGWIEVTSSGKVARGANRDKYLSAGFAPPTQESPPPPVNPGEPAGYESWLRSLLPERLQENGVGAGDNLFHQGLDSLEYMAFLSEVERGLGAGPMQSLALQQWVLHPTLERLAALCSQSASVDSVAIPSPTPQPSPAPGKGATPSRRQTIRRVIQDRGPVIKGKALPYNIGQRLLLHMARSEGLRERLFPQQIALLRQCLPELGTPASREGEIRRSLLVNTWPIWRQYALRSPQEFSRWVEVRGEDRVKQALHSGRGVVVAFHHSKLKLVLPDLPLLQHHSYCVVGHAHSTSLERDGLGALAPYLGFQDEPARLAMRSAQLHHAQGVLDRGGIVIILADDTEGRGGIELPFHGRLRPFRPGIAELAIRHDALLVPLFAGLQESGHVRFDFLAPLESSAANNSDRRDELLRQYAQLLADRWRRSPGDMEWYMLRKFLSFPRCRN